MDCLDGGFLFIIFQRPLRFLIYFKGVRCGKGVVSLLVIMWGQSQVQTQWFLKKLGTYLEAQLAFIFQNNIQKTQNLPIYKSHLSHAKKKPVSIIKNNLQNNRDDLTKMYIFCSPKLIKHHPYLILLKIVIKQLVIMLQSSPNPTQTKTNLILLILTIINLCGNIGIIVIIIIEKLYGFGMTYTTQSYCNVYLTMKYEVYKKINYQVRFVLMIVSAFFLVLLTFSLGRKYVGERKGGLEQKEGGSGSDKGEGNKGQVNQDWKIAQIAKLYIGFVLVILSMLPILISYISYFRQSGPCLAKYQLNWFIILFLSALIVISTLIMLILLLTELSNLKTTTQPTSQQKLVLRENQKKSNISYLQEYALNNIFNKQTSQHYKSIKQEVNGQRQSEFPLLNKMMMNNVSQENRDYFQKKINIFNEKINKNNSQYYYEQRENKKGGGYSNYNNGNGSGIGNVNESGNGSMIRQKDDNSKKSKQKTMIQKYKAKFRQINPYKIQNKKSKQHEMQQMYDIPQEQYRIKNYPKSYHQLIKENKRPVRMPTLVQPPIQYPQDNEEEYDGVNPLMGQKERDDEIANIKLQVLLGMKKQEAHEVLPPPPAEVLPANELGNALMVVVENSKSLMPKTTKPDEIIFKSPEEQIRRIKNIKRRIALANSKQAQLFYHKPGTNIILSKPRKKLFDEDKSNIQNVRVEEKQTIINKLKVAKQIEHQNQLHKDKHKQGQSKKVLTKTEKMMEFLRNKYNGQKEKVIMQEEEEGQHSYGYTQI